MPVPLPPLVFQLELDNMEALVPPSTGQALYRGALAAATVAKTIWLEIADRQGVRATGAYKNGIKAAQPKITRVTPLTGGNREPDRWEIEIELVNTAPHAALVEEGHPAFHLPSHINWGNRRGRIKEGKNGPYLHVAFRHIAFAANAPEKGYTTASMKAMMTAEITAEARKLGQWHKQRVGPIFGPGGQFEAADRYTFTGQRPQGRRMVTALERRLDRSHVEPMFVMGGPETGHGMQNISHEERRSARQVGRDAQGNALVNPAWQSSKWHGLFRAESTGKNESTYHTVRTITPRSQGWNIPAMAGRYPAARTATYLQANPQLLEQALTAGIAELLKGGGK